MGKTRWGIIGPGTIAHNFADGVAECSSGELVAIASRSAPRRASFGDRYTITMDKRYNNYGAICADQDVDAIYIATPHPWHAELAIRALRAGKHVLCEKPAGLIAGEVVAITEVAAQENRFFMEAYMYRCHPQIARMLEIIDAGEIGTVRHITASFGFNAGFDASSRLYDPDLAGGGILDVGGYVVSFARLAAGSALDRISGVGEMSASGVDQTAFAVTRYVNGVTANLAVAVSMNMDNTAMIIGTNGTIHLTNPWMPGRDAGPSDTTIEVTVAGQTRIEALKHPEHLFTFEAETASAAIAEGKEQPDRPAVSWAESIEIAQTLDLWRHDLEYCLRVEDKAAKRIIPGVLPAGLPKMPQKRIEGVDRDISALVMGCDNKVSTAEGAIVWDAWWEAGGNAFDTGFVYGGGLHEQALGHWMASRGVAADAVVIVKGGHTPYCTPRALESQLETSLNRLQLERAPIYIMHRDNLDIPVGEFVETLNRLHDAGKIGVFGGSNWSVERLEHANSYAAEHGLKPMAVLNNNLSLAVMERPLWPGCVTSNTPQMLKYMRSQGTAHFSWSSQARGYFLPEDLRYRLPEDTAPETCFGSANNAERRKRAEILAAEKDVSPHNIATAWVLAQTFPSFALIGPRSPGEIASTLPSLTVTLTPQEVLWLNLEADAREI